jgi:hypothetical protein
MIKTQHRTLALSDNRDNPNPSLPPFAPGYIALRG